MTRYFGRRRSRLQGFAAFSSSIRAASSHSAQRATQPETGQLFSTWADPLSSPFLSGTYLFAALVCLGFAQPFLAIYFLTAWAMTRPHLILGGLARLKALLRRHHLNPAVTFGLSVGLVTGMVLSSALFSPAHAQFLQSAEQAATDLTAGLGGGTADISPVIAFIFGALRLLLIVYMAVALIQIVNAARQGEEWKDLVRTPLLVILVVIIGDFIANIIVGGGGGAAV